MIDKHVRTICYFCFIVSLVYLGTVYERVETTFPMSKQTPSLFDWYTSESTYPPNAIHFGIYAIEPVSQTLYLGVGSARPAEENGALLAQLNLPQTWVNLGELDEQGVHEIVWEEASQQLHVASSDPTDSWEAGNHYVYTPDTGLQKYRDLQNGLVNVIHTWALLPIGENELYASTSGHNGDAPPCEDGVSCYGQVWYTADGGQNWEYRSALGGYRAFDIVSFNGKLYGLYTNERDNVVCYLAVSEDGGLTWETLDLPLLSRVHLTEFQGQLLAVSWDRTAVITIDSNHDSQTHLLPSQTTVGVYYDDIPSYTNYKSVTAVDDTLYLLATTSEEHALLQSSDLTQWQTKMGFPQPPTALAYWPERHQLLIGTSGLDAQLLTLSLDEPSLYLPIISTYP